MRILSCECQESCRFLRVCVVGFCKAWPLPSEFPIFLSFFNSFLELCIFRIDEINTSQLSCIVDLRFLDKPTFASLFVELLLTYLSIFLATSDLAWMLLAVSSAALRTRYIRPEVYHSIWSTVWNPSMHLIGLGPLRCSRDRQCGVPAKHPRSYV